MLARRKKNNPMLIGEPGVGKAAIIEGLAQRIVNEQVPEVLRDKRLVEPNINSMVADSKYRGEFEERVKVASGGGLPKSIATYLRSRNACAGRIGSGALLFVVHGWE